MGKHEKGTPKEIANRTKSKGLQKLRWFCQMCQKQCRDQNGFKCHLTSESHQRQLLLFAENSDQYLREFSNEFKENFIHLLKTAHGTKRIRANEVYQEYIRDKGHVHMNSTLWHTLTGFIEWLGKEGICKVDLTEKGWYIAYIDQEAEMRKQELQRKAKAEKDDEDRQRDAIEAQVQRALELQGDVEESKPTELLRAEDDEKVTFAIGGGNVKPTIEELQKPIFNPTGAVFDKLEKVKKEVKEESSRKRRSSRTPERDSRHARDSRREDSQRPSTSKRDSEKKKSALEEIREQEERKKERNNRKDYWMQPGIIVKIITKKLGAEFYKEKGKVREMVDDYTALVKTDQGTVIRVDQTHVETVIPSVGRQMLIVNGAYRGQKATLDAILENDFQLQLTLADGPLRGRSVKVPYEDASKLA